MIVIDFPPDLNMTFSEWLSVLNYIEVCKKYQDAVIKLATNFYDLEATEKGKEYFREYIKAIKPDHDERL